MTSSELHTDPLPTPLHLHVFPPNIDDSDQCDWNERDVPSLEQLRCTLGDLLQKRHALR